MSKEQQGTNLNQSRTSMTDDVLATSLPARSGSYRSLSAKRPRDPSHRKSVSFNDVPIVHEVPSHDSMRNSNCDTYRSWTYTDATPPTSITSPFYASQILSPFNSTSAAAQKLHANRLSSAFYSSSSGSIPSRLPDWTVRNKSSKITTNSEETAPLSIDHTSSWNPPTIVVHTPDERKDLTMKSNTSHIAAHRPSSPSQPPPVTSENSEEKKVPYRSPLMSEPEHHRSLPFTYGPFSDSTTTYTSMFSTHLTSPSNHYSHDPISTTQTRTARARSATLPVTVTHSSARLNDTVSITPFRTTTATIIQNGLSPSSRTVLRPTTIAFQCNQPTNTTLTNGSSNTMNTTSTTNTMNSSLTNTGTNSGKPPTVPSRYGSSAAAAAAAHSRFVLPTNRTVSSASLATSTIKYAFAHPAVDSSMPITMSPQASIPRPPPTAFPRSRSANVMSTRRNATSPIIMADGSSNGATNQGTTNLYSTTKRNPNVRQTYGSYYMHRVLLPTTTN